MLKENVFVEVNVQRSSQQYRDLGYDCKNGDVIVVNQKDLHYSAQCLVTLICDCCEKEYQKNNKTWRKAKAVQEIKMDGCCRKCQAEIIKKTNMMRYGVSNISMLDDVKDKVKRSTLEKYGVENAIKLDKFKEKRKKTTLDKYGVENVFQVQEFKDRIKDVNLKKFGYTTYTQTNEYKEKLKNVVNNRINEEKLEIAEKRKQTNLEKFGYENAIQNPEIKQKAMETLYKNGTAPVSKEQKYIHDLYGGELNLPISRAFLDIAFPSEMIYVEYQGGGHWNSILFGDETQEDFKRRERNRFHTLKREGWNMVEIISRKDNLPLDEQLTKMLLYAKEWINQGHSWISFDIDNGIVKTSQYEFTYDYGQTRKLPRIRKEVA